MPIIGEIVKPIGRTNKKIYADVVSVANGGTVDTGLATVDVVVLTTTNAEHVAAVTAVSGGTVTVGLYNIYGTAITTAEPVHIIAIGDPH